MSDTLEKTMTVLFARQVLHNTRAAPEDRVAEAERVMRAFHAAKPRRQCYVCPSGVWSEHETKAGDDVCWGCARCHTSADLTRDEIRDQQAERHAEQQAAAKAAEVAAAAAPKPRTVLRERLQALAQARSELQKLGAAAPAARSRVWDLQAAVEGAEQAAEEANAGAASSLAEALTNDKPIGPASSAAKAREYIIALGQLAWLVREHATPDGDRRAHQLVAGADTPPAQWPEAAAGAGTQVMQDAMAALMDDSEAVI